MTTRANETARVGNVWLRFSLKTMFVTILVVSAFFAGRAPMLHRVMRAEREIQRIRQEANACYDQLLTIHRATLQRQALRSIDAGMMIDAAEHQQ